MDNHSSDSMYAVAWKHYSKSSRSMVGWKNSSNKAKSELKTTKQIDAEIDRIRQEIARLGHKV